MKARPVPPRGERISRGLGHLGFLAAAIFSHIGQLPVSVLIAADTIQLTLWAILMSTGSLGAWAAWRGRYKLEYAMLPFMAGAVLVYIIALLNVVATGENPGSGLPLILMCSLILYLAARWFSLNQLLDGPLEHLLARLRRRSDE